MFCLAMVAVFKSIFDFSMENVFKFSFQVIPESVSFVTSKRPRPQFCLMVPCSIQSLDVHFVQMEDLKALIDMDREYLPDIAMLEDWKLGVEMLKTKSIDKVEEKSTQLFNVEQEIKSFAADILTPRTAREQMTASKKRIVELEKDAAAQTESIGWLMQTALLSDPGVRVQRIHKLLLRMAECGATPPLQEIPPEFEHALNPAEVEKLRVYLQDETR